MTYWRSVSAIAGLACITASASAINILVNPGFETGTHAGWTTSGHTISGDSNTGSFASFANGNFWVRQDFAAVDVSDVLEVSHWIKQPNIGATYFAAYDFFYGDNTTEQWVPGGANAGVYAKIDVTSELDAGKTLVAIRAWGYTSGNPNTDLTFYDDFVVDVVPEPATGLVLLSGLVIAACRRRKKATV